MLPEHYSNDTSLIRGAFLFSSSTRLTFIPFPANHNALDSEGCHKCQIARKICCQLAGDRSPPLKWRVVQRNREEIPTNEYFEKYYKNLEFCFIFLMFFGSLFPQWKKCWIFHLFFSNDVWWQNDEIHKEIYPWAPFSPILFNFIL